MGSVRQERPDDLIVGLGLVFFNLEFYYYLSPGLSMLGY